MNKLKCYIVDDEERAINTLEFLLDYYCRDSVIVVGSASVYEKAYDYLKHNVPDVLFLDIKLGRETGFTLLESLGSMPYTDIVIISAYSEHALEAFRYDTVNYLLKPVDPKALQKTIERIERKKSTRLIAEPKQTTEPENLFYPTRRGYSSLDYKQIVCIKGDGSYVNIHLLDKKILTVSKNLSFFEQLLNGKADFIRVHRSYIINKIHIKEFNKQNSTKLIMTGDIIIPVSIILKDLVLKAIGW